MLKVVAKVSLKQATDPQHGNVQTFFDRLLVEVDVDNYQCYFRGWGPQPVQYMNSRGRISYQ